ncbi:hypothetical protein [uncultured Victivallis sp.]|uniref:hypothetical protein n=1 Tax=uncultured Victivallis sp. TaxID=354118 RepID=UPI0025D2B554|nr:hypothetical protein [uncultured Victivallis sp.]
MAIRHFSVISPHEGSAKKRISDGCFLKKVAANRLKNGIPALIVELMEKGNFFRNGMKWVWIGMKIWLKQGL